MLWIKTIGFLLIVGLVLYGLHRFSLWAEERGWIYYKNKKPKGGTLGNALLEIQSYFEPDKQHILELRTEIHQEEKEAGDPPDSESAQTPALTPEGS